MRCERLPWSTREELISSRGSLHQGGLRIYAALVGAMVGGLAGAEQLVLRPVGYRQGLENRLDRLRLAR